METYWSPFEATRTLQRKKHEAELEFRSGGGFIDPRLHVIALVFAVLAFSGYAFWFEARSRMMSLERPAAVDAPSRTDAPESPAPPNETFELQQLG